MDLRIQNTDTKCFGSIVIWFALAYTYDVVSRYSVRFVFVNCFSQEYAEPTFKDQLMHTSMRQHNMWSSKPCHLEHLILLTMPLYQKWDNLISQKHNSPSSSRHLPSTHSPHPHPPASAKQMKRKDVTWYRCLYAHPRAANMSVRTPVFTSKIVHINQSTR